MSSSKIPLRGVCRVLDSVNVEEKIQWFSMTAVWQPV
jgi:hypothetical protein